MGRVRRYLIRQLLHSNGVHLQVVKHELYRVLKVEGRNGNLTDKEAAFLQKRLDTLDTLCADLTRLGDKIQKELNSA